MSGFKYCDRVLVLVLFPPTNRTVDIRKYAWTLGVKINFTSVSYPPFFICSLENLTFRLWKVIINLLLDDSVQVKHFMAAGLSNILQSTTPGRISKQFLTPSTIPRRLSGIAWTVNAESIIVQDTHNHLLAGRQINLTEPTSIMDLYPFTKRKRLEFPDE
jgi:hypothetical protein